MKNKKLFWILIAAWIAFGFGLQYFNPGVQLRDPATIVWIATGVLLIVWSAVNLTVDDTPSQ